MISDYLIQIVLIIIAVVIEGFVLTNLPEGATRKKFFSVAMALVIVGSLVWVAYEYGQNSVVAPEVEIEVTRPVPVESTRVVTETVSVEVTRIVPIEVTTLVDNPQEVSVEVTQEVTRIVTETVPIEVVVTGTPNITVETESVTPTI